ncbi:MAG: four helix bundle protein [Prevotellaceae bacterium]|jgi:four helix bundle protein|nr:four helix bundle protein [Prevotellaceae bacterium]
MKENIVKIKSFNFALRIINLYKFLCTDKKEFVLSKQVLRSGTAIGALVYESEHAQSSADFISKMNIALKEANETVYWLSLLYQSDYLSKESYLSISEDSEELVRLLASIVKTSKTKLKI